MTCGFAAGAGRRAAYSWHLIRWTAVGFDDRTKSLLRIVLAACLACAAPAGGARAADAPIALLFVGNSLIVTNNLPATTVAVFESAGVPARAYVLAAPGAELAQFDASGAAAAIGARDVGVVLLQERGGILSCASGGAESTPACRRSARAHRDWRKAGKRAGAKVLMLGTYQTDPRHSRSLSDSEKQFAKAASLPAPIAVGRMLAEARARAPGLPWLAADGLHPGDALTVAEALMIYRRLTGRVPPRAALIVRGARWIAATRPPDYASLPDERALARTHDAALVGAVLDALGMP